MTVSEREKKPGRAKIILSQQRRRDKVSRITSGSHSVCVDEKNPTRRASSRGKRTQIAPTAPGKESLGRRRYSQIKIVNKCQANYEPSGGDPFIRVVVGVPWSHGMSGGSIFGLQWATPYKASTAIRLGGGKRLICEAGKVSQILGKEKGLCSPSSISSNSHWRKGRFVMNVGKITLAMRKTGFDRRVLRPKEIRFERIRKAGDAKKKSALFATEASFKFQRQREKPSERQKPPLHLPPISESPTTIFAGGGRCARNVGKTLTGALV